MQGERSGQKSKAQDSTKARAETTDDLEPEVAKNQQPKQPLEEVVEPKAKKQKKKNIAVKKERLDKVAQPAEKKQKMQQLDTEMAGGDAEPDTEPVLLRKREKGRASFADAPAGDEIEKAEATTQETKAYKSSERKRILVEPTIRPGMMLRSGASIRRLPKKRRKKPRLRLVLSTMLSRGPSESVASLCAKYGLVNIVWCSSKHSFSSPPCDHVLQGTHCRRALPILISCGLRF